MLEILVLDHNHLSGSLSIFAKGGCPLKVLSLSSNLFDFDDAAHFANELSYIRSIRTLTEFNVDGNIFNTHISQYEEIAIDVCTNLSVRVYFKYLIKVVLSHCLHHCLEIQPSDSGHDTP
jgi:hypothetical protein